MLRSTVALLTKFVSSTIAEFLQAPEPVHKFVNNFIQVKNLFSNFFLNICQVSAVRNLTTLKIGLQRFLILNKIKIMFNYFQSILQFFLQGWTGNGMAEFVLSRDYAFVNFHFRIIHSGTTVLAAGRVGAKWRDVAGAGSSHGAHGNCGRRRGNASATRRYFFFRRNLYFLLPTFNATWVQIRVSWI